MGELLPATARAVESLTDRPVDICYPEEQALVARAAAGRRREFVTVRSCAREALAALSIGPAPILPRLARDPQWPPGVVGSMTHCVGYRAAAVAHSHDLASVGIDAEPAAALPPGLLDTVMVPQDRPGLDMLAGRGVASDRLLFSAKEAAYKAWFPLARRWLGFHDVHVDLRPDGTLTAEVLVDPVLGDGTRLAHLDGRWATARGLVFTAVSVPAGSCSRD